MSTKVLDPLSAAQRIERDYRRYLQSAFSPADPELGRDFRDQLTNGLRLSRGPILQAQAPYSAGASIASLIDEGVLDHGFLRHDGTLLDLERPLYVHQEQAIRKAVSGRNLMVATGTGSGKTEAFMLPIVNHLLGEISAGTIEQPGVRALLLYPMNALVNDQLRRLREILNPFPEITFGRYVGETENTRKAAEDDFRRRNPGQSWLPNEMLAREEMKARPPHILVTNFAMLEYLLLRPDEQFFFDGPTGAHWRFFVLDEVHVYDGAKGAEIGMLLRRVRDRVLQSERGKLTCIGTSATLGKGKDDLPRLADFGQQIFDEPFEWVEDDVDRQDIVEATRDSLVSAAASWFCPPEVMIPLRDQYRAGASAGDLADLLVEHGAPKREKNETTEAWLGRALGCETHVVALQHMLLEGSVDLAEAGLQVMSSKGFEAELSALVDVCVGAEVADGRALLPARWHFLLRALEGAFVCLHPEHPPTEPRLLLSRHTSCPGCMSQRRTAAMFETAVCRRCGAKYVVGEESRDSEEGPNADSILRPARQVADNPRTFLVLDQPTAPDEIFEDEDDAAIEEDTNDRFDPAVICVECGTLGKKKVSCGCNAPVAALREVKPTSSGKPVRLCAACGGRTSGGSITQRFLTGSDAPVAVIATSLYQELPPMKRIKGGVGEARKLLSFADSRQDAAFFAPYLERTYNRAVQRRLLWQVISDRQDDGIQSFRMRDLVAPLKNRAMNTGIIDEFDDEKSPDAQARHWIYGEIVGTDRRQSLEGVGLAEIAVPIPRDLEIPKPLLDLGLTEDEVLDLIRVLLDTVRRGRAVTVTDEVDLDDPIFEGRPMTGLRGDQSATRILSWNPSRGSNQRLRYLQKVLVSLGKDPNGAPQLLRNIWERWLSNDDWSEVLVPTDAAFEKGTVFQIDARRIEITPWRDDHKPGRCTHCRQIWWRSVRNVCPGVGCDGQVEPYDALGENNHYRALYTSLDPIGLRVEEHTAQLSNKVASERQQDFINGKINALSSSTTFELGVDVGAIQAVLMRNVPPSAANYVQRAGRAGRRAGSPALVVTFAQRRSHDLQFFENPKAMVDGHVAAPVVNINNPAIVRRHLNAVAFAEFEKQFFDGRERPHQRVEEFFTAEEGLAPSEQFLEWLHTEPAEILAAVTRIVPNELQDVAEINPAKWGWRDGLDGDPKEEGRGRMVVAGREIKRELSDLDHELDEAYEARNSKRIRSLEDVRKAIATGRTLDRLARVGVLPKYGFPVDVVPLDLGTNTLVDLSRDLSQAIAEFAPGNRIVANKALWEPVGLKVQDSIPLVHYRVGTCNDSACGTRWTWPDVLEEPPECPSCGGTGKKGELLIQPKFGFVGHRLEARPGDQRPPRVGYATSFFDNYEGSEPNWVDRPIGTAESRYRPSKHGRITVENRGAGAGYRVCNWCGYIEQALGKASDSHERPYAWRQEKKYRTTCGGTLRRVLLGHWYLTDTIQVDPGVRFGPVHMKSLAAALQAATDAVGIAQNDVSSSVASLGPGVATVVLFDSVPGGAGHAHRIGEMLPELFEAAASRVASCDCGEETSCYGCLRSYRNQRDHDLLERRKALEVFRAMGL